MTTEFTPLQLLAKDLEDLKILAAHLQDALLPLVSMVYKPKEETFTLLANRFCWEHPPIDFEGEPLYHRVHSGLSFHNVTKVHHKGFDRKGKVRHLNLLTIQQKTPGTILLICSGNSEIRIQTKNLHFQMGDVSPPWPTRKRPMHIHDHLKELGIKSDGD